MSQAQPDKSVSGLLRQVRRSVAIESPFVDVPTKGLPSLAERRPRRGVSTGSRLRAAHRRRRPQGLDARGAPWPVSPRGVHDGRTAVVSPASSVEPVQLRAIMESAHGEPIACTAPHGQPSYRLSPAPGRPVRHDAGHSVQSSGWSNIESAVTRVGDGPRTGAVASRRPTRSGRAYSPRPRRRHCGRAAVRSAPPTVAAAWAGPRSSHAKQPIGRRASRACARIRRLAC